MRQLLLPPDYAGGPEVIFRGKRFHYLIDVLRLKTGDRLRGLDPSGRAVGLELTVIGAAECRFAVRPLTDETADRAAGDPSDASRSGALTGPGAPPEGVRITLFQCVPKGKKMDLIVRQATETGVASIVPVFSRHTVPRYDRQDWENKRKRWLRVMGEAVQQCGRGDLPALEEPVALEKLPGFWKKAGPGILFHEQPLAHETLHEYLFPDASEVALVIGPEGGLAPDETGLLRDSGFGAVYLGENVLRVETATLFAIAAVRIVLLEKSGWKLSDK